MQEWCQNPRQELRSSRKTMEVCCSSYRRNLFLDPIAVHFLNLETSAIRLAQALLVDVFGDFSMISILFARGFPSQLRLAIATWIVWPDWMQSRIACSRLETANHRTWKFPLAKELKETTIPKKYRTYHISIQSPTNPINNNLPRHFLSGAPLCTSTFSTRFTCAQGTLRTLPIGERDEPGHCVSFHRLASSLIKLYQVGNPW